MKILDRPTNSRPWFILALAVTVIVVVGTFSRSIRHYVLSPAAQSADRHAVVAGNVMTRPPRVSANDAAYSVVGTGVDDTITALEASGTTYDGHALLKISVETGSGFSESSTVRCYSYNFRHEMGDGAPHHVACPTRPTLVLTSPVPIPDVIAPDVLAKVRALLGSLSQAQRRDSQAVRAMLARLYPPSVTIYADVMRSGVLEAGARTWDTCFYATVDQAGHVRLVPGHGSDCRGG